MPVQLYVAGLNGAGCVEYNREARYARRWWSGFMHLLHY